MADTTPIPAADLPKVTPGTLDSVVGVDESTGEARRFGLSELPASTAQAAQLQTYVDAAEAARDAAQASGNIYADTTAGLAATTSGQYFSVPGASADDYLILYKNNAGSAVEVKRYPSADRVTGLEARVSTVEPVAEAVGTTSALYTGTGPIRPFVTDAVGAVLLGYDETAGEVFGRGLTTESSAAAIAREEIGEAGAAEFIGSSGVFPLMTDNAGRVLLGYDAANARIVGKGLTAASSGAQALTALASPPVAKAINHLLFYGQSLSVGATATTILSTTQPYSNVTFQGGPRAWDGATWSYSPFKPLVEDAVTPSPDGYAGSRGETCCSGAANYATTLAALDGKSPSSHVILSSTVGHGGYRIDQLDKASAWYANLTAMVTAAKAINADYAVHAVAWIQGENDAVTGTQTPYATYRAALEQLQADLETDIIAISGQASPVYLLTYQISYAAATWPDQAKAQLDLAQKNAKFVLVTPCYHLPFAGDNVHLTNVGYKWLGAYFGRAYKQLAIDGKRPKWLNPVSATRRGATLRVRFDVPVKPMVLDASNLAPTTNHGFRVVDAGGTVAISNVSVDGEDVVLALGATPAGATTVRYGLDYIGSGLTITGGASGNLRDSSPDVITISGVDRHLYNVCPHFELPVVALGE